MLIYIKDLRVAVWYLDNVECAICALTSRLNELKKFKNDDASSVMKMIIKVNEYYPLGRSRLFAETFNELSKILNNNDPYLRDKEDYEYYVQSNVVERIRDLDTLSLLKVAAASNSVDAPMPGYEFTEEMFMERLMDEPAWLGVSGGEALKILEDSTHVTYIVDNAGEFSIDRLLILRLAKRSRVTVIARSLPYETDVTYDYVKSAFFNEPNVEVVATGSRYPAFLIDDVYKRYIEGSSLVISKGVGNLEAYLEANRRHGNVLFLFRVKCRPIMRLLNVPFGKPVVMHSRFINSIKLSQT